MLDVQRPRPTSGALAARSKTASNGMTFRRIAPALLALFDLVVIFLAFLTAYWIRYDLELGPHIRDQLGFEAYRPLLFPLFVLMLFALWAKGAYRLRLGDEIEDDISAIFSAATISAATIVVLAAMLQQYQYSRGVMIYLWVSLIVLLIAGRILFRFGMTHLYRQGVGTRRLLVIGATDMGKMIMQGVANRRDLGYELVGFVHAKLEHANPETKAEDFGRFRNLGFAADVPAILRAEQVDEVIIALPAAAHEEIWPILQECDSGGIGFKIVPDFFELSLGRVQVDDLAGIPILDVRDQPLKRTKLALKKGVDWILGAVLSILFSPVLLLTALAVKLALSGPIVICQERVGQSGNQFTCYKFRSMRKDADEEKPRLQIFNEAKGPLFKMQDDPRRTRVGGFIRRHSLDELPQLWNVLRGEMSLVGPRPALPEEVSRYDPGSIVDCRLSRE